MLSEYTRTAIAITVLGLIAEPTTSGAHARCITTEYKEQPQRVRINEVPKDRSIDWYDTLIRLLDQACEVLICDQTLLASGPSFESKMEWWNQLYRTRGVRKGMSDAQRKHAAAILHDLTLAVLCAGDEIDPALRDRFLLTLDGASKAIASETETPTAQERAR